jgi:hypothetical protein
MRDHPNHATAVMGGTWGVKLVNPEVRQNFGKSFKKMFKEKEIVYASRETAGWDQTALKHHVW